MRRHREDQFEAPGKDSFLDVVANVVAILIILVIVVGSQASQIVIQKETARQEALAAVPRKDISQTEAEVRAVEVGVRELEQRIDRQKFEIAYRQAERDRVQLLVTVAEQRLKEHRDQLGGAERERYDLDALLVASKGELAKLSQAQASPGKPPPTVLQHLPTPMARTVFGAEVHFRLLGGRLAYVPWEEMLLRMKAEAPQHIGKLKSTPRVELSLPAIGGFRARYILRKVDAQLQTRLGTTTQSSVELEQIYFVDAESNLGQPVAEALAPNSEFRGRLAEHKPQATTVTIWVYPDSFDDFRTIKAELFKLGYLTAARPLPDGLPIAGGPEGSRSSAE